MAISCEFNALKPHYFLFLRHISTEKSHKKLRADNLFFEGLQFSSSGVIHSRVACDWYFWSIQHRMMTQCLIKLCTHKPKRQESLSFSVRIHSKKRYNKLKTTKFLEKIMENTTSMLFAWIWKSICPNFLYLQFSSNKNPFKSYYDHTETYYLFETLQSAKQFSKDHLKWIIPLFS